MPKFYLVDIRKQTEQSIDFSEFVGITKGMSVSSLAAGNDYLELGLSATYNLRIYASPGHDISAQLVSTLNPGELKPIRIEMISDDEVVTAELLEKRIHAFRQMYAISLALQDNREDEIVAALKADRNVDLEATLVTEENKLIIRDAGAGSLVLTFIAKSKNAYKAILGLCALPYAEGRSALLLRVKAETSLKELSVTEKELKLQLDRANGFLDLLKKAESLKDPSAKQLIMETIAINSHVLIPSINYPISLGANSSVSSPILSAKTTSTPKLRAPLKNKMKSGDKEN